MWLTFDCNILVRIVSTFILAFAIAVNGIGNLFGIGDIIDTEPYSSYALTAVESAALDETQTTEPASDTESYPQDIVLENKNVLYIRSSLRKVFNRYFNAFGIKSAIAAAEIELSPEKLTITAGTTKLLDADILPANARNTNVRFQSDNPRIASVDIFGVITARKPGSATVYAIAEDGGFYDKCYVSVTEGSVACDSVSLSASGISLELGLSETFDVSIFPVNTTEITSISNSDINIVKASLVDEKLTVTGKAAGTAIITVRCGNAFDTLYVNVTDPSNESDNSSNGIDINSLEIFGGSSESNIGTIIRSVDTLSDGSYIACGTTASTNGSFEYLYNSSLGWKTPFSFIAKYTESGVIEWIELVGDSSASVLIYDIAVLSDGNIVAVGTYEYPSTYTQKGGIDAAIFTFSANGGYFSRKILEGSGDDFFYSVAATSDGYVVGGKTTSTDGAFEGIPGMSAVAFNFDLNNTVLWKRYFNASKSSHIADIDVDGDNNIFLSCITTATDGDYAGFDGLIGSYSDTVIFKYSYSGDCLWHHVLATSGTDEFDSIAADGSGGCVVAGNYTLVSTVTPDGTLEGIHNCGSTDALAIRLDEKGERLWCKIISGFYDDFITDVVHTQNGFAVTGYTTSTNREFASVGNLGGTDAFIYFVGMDGTGISVMAQAGSSDDAALCLTYSETANELFVAGRTASSDGSFADKNSYGNSTVGYNGRYEITVE